MVNLNKEGVTPIGKVPFIIAGVAMVAVAIYAFLHRNDEDVPVVPPLPPVAEASDYMRGVLDGACYYAFHRDTPTGHNCYSCSVGVPKLDEQPAKPLKVDFTPREDEECNGTNRLIIEQ